MGSIARASILTILGAWSGSVSAAVTIEYLGPVLPTDVSADGSVVVGNLPGNYETFRWTSSTGVTPLGMSSVEVLGVGAGTPNVSADGQKVSATILGQDSTYATQGLWTLGTGWEETMPPVPFDGGLLDQSFGSAWGLSGDGETLVGFYWRPGQTDGSAHASRWSPAGIVTDLGSNGGSSRANAANHDGSVIVGWAERFDGTWQPTVWTSAGRQVLTATEGFCQADAVNPAGTKVTGSTFNLTTLQFSAASWTWDGTTWVEQVLGRLPGTATQQGYVAGQDMTADGSLIVGYNRFFFGNSTGFLWTAQKGIIDVAAFLASRGVTVPTTLDIQNLTAISDDGRVIAGVGQYTTPPFAFEGFLIHVDSAVSADVAPLASGPVPHISLSPNPSGGATRVTLELPGATTSGNLSIYDSAGRVVRDWGANLVPSGRRQFEWDGRDANGYAAAPGVYFVCWNDMNSTASEKLVLIR